MAKTDRQYKEEGRVIRFGRSQLHNPTPVWMRYIVRVLAMTGSVMAFLNIQEPWAPIVTMWIAKSTGVLVIINRFTGWDCK